MDWQPLQGRFRAQAAMCRDAGSELTARLLEGAADDAARPGAGPARANRG